MALGKSRSKKTTKKAAPPKPTPRPKPAPRVSRPPSPPPDPATTLVRELLEWASSATHQAPGTLSRLVEQVEAKKVKAEVLRKIPPTAAGDTGRRLERVRHALMAGI